MKRRPPKPPNSWQSSPQWTAIGREAIGRFNRVGRHQRPKCGAKARTTGEPCRQLAGANGRCYVHGGRTPAGKDWHKPQWPNGRRPDAIAKAERKIRDRERVARKRARRLAAMTPDECERHAAWHKSHAPGPPGPRARARAEREGAAALREILDGLDAPTAIDPEIAGLEAEAAVLRRRIEAALVTRTLENPFL